MAIKPLASLHLNFSREISYCDCDNNSACVRKRVEAPAPVGKVCVLRKCCFCKTALKRSSAPLRLSLSLSLPTEQNRATGGRPLKCMRRGGGGGVGSEARLPLQIAYCCEERDEGEIKRGGGRENCERSKFPSKEVKEGRPPARARAQPASFGVISHEK